MKTTYDSVIQAIKVSKTVTAISQQDGNDINILSDINLSVKPSETLAILGSSGSGKSTLLGLLAGLDTVTSGDIIIDGESITDKDEDGRAAIRSSKIGFIFQSFQLINGLTALENVLLPLELKYRNPDTDLAVKLLEKTGLGHRLHHYPNQLSGGEQQRVAIARAFVCSPKLVFADEPTGNLDNRTGERIIDLLFDINTAQKTTLVIVTHDESLANRCSRKLLLNDGKLQPY